ncbi:MAG TPA: desulfoferrodoxin [Methanocorpusculum sp.]|nr:desulfoferrodoxin [Methanocorpusculum sp.]HJJ53828.1 desulfoferrodoxin [Methanocorpusculum sp.]HKL97237.1 desulfoferrodoxin [Methanocorpusculum sp.]
MTKTKEIYKCFVCGNTVKVLAQGKGELVCCGKPMELLPENTADATTEKHVPVVEKISEGYKVTVGSVAHPMTDEHYITWIALRTDDGIIHEKFLIPGEKPEMIVKTTAKADKACEYCNIHNLWVKKE